MKKLAYLMTAVVFSMFMAAPAFAQSAKTGVASSSLTLIEATTGTTSWEPILRTDIDVPQQKELVMDVSLQCGLYTDTLVRSKGGTKDTSTAEATVAVRVEVQRMDNYGNPVGSPIYAGPNEGSAEGYGVVFCSRQQTLSATLQGIIENLACFPGGVFDPDAPGCNLTAEEIQLILDTLNANAFNFVSPNLQSGYYRVTAEAEIRTSTEYQSGSAEAKGLIGLGSMVVDEVRFVQGATGGTSP